MRNQDADSNNNWKYSSDWKKVLMNQETNYRCTILLANFVHSPDPLSLKNARSSAENATFFKCFKCCSKNAPSPAEIIYTNFCNSRGGFSSASKPAHNGTAGERSLTIGQTVPFFFFFKNKK